MSVDFDDPNLVSAARLAPLLALAESAGLRELADEHLSVPTDMGANAGLKVSSLVAGMVAGADSIDDVGLLRHGGMAGCSATRTRPRRWSVPALVRLRSCPSARRGRVAVPGGLAGRAPLIAQPDGPAAGSVMVDIDDTIIEVYGYAKQGSGYGYSGLTSRQMTGDRKYSKRSRSMFVGAPAGRNEVVPRRATEGSSSRG